MSHREDLKLTPRFSKAIFSPLTTFQLAHSVTVAVFERLGGVVVQKVGVVVAFKSIQLVINSTVNYRSPSLPPFTNTCSFDKGRAPCSVKIIHGPRIKVRQNDVIRPHQILDRLRTLTGCGRGEEGDIVDLVLGVQKWPCVLLMCGRNLNNEGRLKRKV